jgi:hypothetical protein
MELGGDMEVFFNRLWYSANFAQTEFHEVRPWKGRVG